MKTLSVSNDTRQHVADALADHTTTGRIIGVSSPSKNADHGFDGVVRGLSETQQKWLPSKYFYDATGSKLYEEITGLPEYYPMAKESEILTTQGAAIWETLDTPKQLIELGSGSSTKTRFLLDAWKKTDTPLTYVPVDVSASIVEFATTQLQADYPTLHMVGLAGEYFPALDSLTPCAQRAFLFLGSSLGNSTPQEVTIFMEHIVAAMAPGNTLLLGFDRQIHPGKPKEVIEAAYNDSQEVTAAFNLNILTHLNGLLDADFDLSQWQHRAHYNSTEHRIEMHLISQGKQTVHLKKIDLSASFKEGETIRSEISRKFDPDTLANIVAQHGLTQRHLWCDALDYYGVMLLEKT